MFLRVIRHCITRSVFTRPSLHCSASLSQPQWPMITENSRWLDQGPHIVVGCNFRLTRTVHQLDRPSNPKPTSNFADFPANNVAAITYLHRHRDSRFITICHQSYWLISLNKLSRCLTTAEITWASSPAITISLMEHS